MYSYLHFFSTGFLYINILFNGPTKSDNTSTAQYCCSSQLRNCRSGPKVRCGVNCMKSLVTVIVGEMFNFHFLLFTMTLLKDVNIRMSFIPPARLLKRPPVRIFIHSSKHFSRNFSMSSPAFWVSVFLISIINLRHEYKSFTSQSLVQILAKRP